MANKFTARDYPAQVKSSRKGQYPEAIVLSCIDIRVPFENLYDRGIGDIFVARVAGNFVKLLQLAGATSLAYPVTQSLIHLLP